MAQRSLRVPQRGNADAVCGQGAHEGWEQESELDKDSKDKEVAVVGAGAAEQC
jgi:hypothetical protein